MLHPGSRVEDAWEAAYKEALTLEPWEQARFLTSTIGSRFTTAGLGLKSARVVRRWIEEGSAPREHDVTARLNVLFRVTRAIAEIYSPTVATAFWRSANPQLDDESPIVVLADGAPSDVQRPILAAARAFLEG
jgi:hypothetical protein